MAKKYPMSLLLLTTQHYSGQTDLYHKARKKVTISFGNYHYL